jgi:hypothetical protein
MEKRKEPRRLINTTLVFRHFNSLASREEIEGDMKNCCSAGLNAELKLQIKAGTILVVRATGPSRGYSINEGYRSYALVEVKWSELKNPQGDVRYATGMRYLMLY